MKIHLTMRAKAWFDGVIRMTEVPVGRPACGAKKEKGAGPQDWCRKEDVVAIVQGKKLARLWHLGYLRGVPQPSSQIHDEETWTYSVRPPRLPTCPECLVLYDQGLQKAMAREDKDAHLERENPQLAEVDKLADKHVPVT